jgi:hypothetical protein
MYFELNILEQLKKILTKNIIIYFNRYNHICDAERVSAEKDFLTKKWNYS